MISVADPFMSGVRPSGLQRGRGGFLRSADDSPYVTDPTGEIVKTGDRKGEVKRLKYGSPSNRGREIENDSGLVKYKQRLTLLGIGMEQSLATACSHLADLPIGSPEFNTAADTIVVCADRITRSSLAADRGTHGHLICELWDRGGGRCAFTTEFIKQGEALGLDKQAQLHTSMAWSAMLRENGLEILAIEASCVDDNWRLAGTLDRIVRTTKPLTFVKPGGELVTIPANTVLILDIKFGKCRKAHPIQIASYAQSVPYDTDTEERGEWPFEIDQTHALIAHGDFGDDTRPVTIELVWVDLVAGREHGGQCVVDAKAWAARDDVFSVAQIVEGEGVTAGFVRGIEGPIGTGHTSPSTLSPDDCDPHGIPRPIVEGVESPVVSGATPSTLSPESSPAAGEERADERPTLAPSPATSTRLIDGVIHGAARGNVTVTERLALVDARGALCPSPDEGADWSSDEFAPLWEQLRGLFDELHPNACFWRSELAGQAKRRHVDFLAQGGMTERRFWINKAVIALALAGEGDDILRELLSHIIGDVALFPGVEPGHALGSLGAVEAQSFAHHVDAYLSPPPAA